MKLRTVLTSFRVLLLSSDQCGVITMVQGRWPRSSERALNGGGVAGAILTR